MNKIFFFLQAYSLNFNSLSHMFSGDDDDDDTSTNKRLIVIDAKYQQIIMGFVVLAVPVLIQ